MKTSVLFIAYNQAQFVADAIRSAMAQDYPKYQLVVCDDASSDETREILEKELEQCPPHISLIRTHSETNQGLIAAFNRGIELCSGDVIIGMAGDDISFPNRVSILCRVFSENPDCMLAYSNFERIDSDGHFLAGSQGHHENQCFSHGSRISDIFANSPVYGATAAYRATLHDKFGPMARGNHPEDRSYWVRSLLIGEIRYVAEPLVKWRTHSNNWSNYQKGTDSTGTRKRVLKGLLYRQTYPRQFIRDINHAVTHSLTSKSLAKQLLSMIAQERERERLRRYSMAAAPWKLWQGSAFRLMKNSPSFGNFWRIAHSDFPLRLSLKKRERHWARRLRTGKD